MVHDMYCLRDIPFGRRRLHIKILLCLDAVWSSAAALMFDCDVAQWTLRELQPKIS